MVPYHSSILPLREAGQNIHQHHHELSANIVSMQALTENVSTPMST